MTTHRFLTPNALPQTEAGETSEHPAVMTRAADQRFCAAMRRAGYVQEAPRRPASTEARHVRTIHSPTFIPSASSISTP